MEKLRELVGLITSHKVKGIEIIGGGDFYNSKLQKLYEGIQKGLFESDDDALNAIYKNNKKSEANYIKLKSRLEQRLINTLFFIDINKSNHNEIQRAYYTCHKDWAALKILFGKGARLTAIPIAERILRKAEKFEFSQLVLDISRTLRVHYASIDRDKKKYAKYNEYVKKHQKILMVELLSEEYYSNISSMFTFSKMTKSEISILAINYSNILKKETKNLNSYRLNLLASTVHVYRYQITNDYKNVIKECERAISFFKSKPYQASKVAVFTFQFKMLACYIQLKQFKKGEEVAKQCLYDMPEGSPNWFYTHVLYLTLCWHTRKFQEAYEVYLNVFENKNFNRQYAKAAEDWKIHEAYINYFIMNGEIVVDEDKVLKKFRLNKFLNELPVYSKDKRGKNIPILIIHILFLLQQGKYADVIDRVEAINQYTYRYLRDDDTYRSSCFIKMLIQLPKANFHKEAVIRKTDKLFEKLKNKPLEISGQSDEIEIVPYEILWDFVINSLDNQFH
jgi:hypothetical protein